MLPTDRQHPFARHLPYDHYTYSFGWAMSNARQGTFNDQGFANSADFTGANGILVVGDSYIEARMLAYKQTLQGRLSELAEGPIHAAAASGNGLADALVLIEHYSPILHPRAVVVFVEPFDLTSLTAEPSRGHSSFRREEDQIWITHNEYSESSVKRLFTWSSLLRYAYYNLKVTELLTKRSSPRPGAAAFTTTGDQPFDDAVLHYFFDRLRSIAKAHAFEVIFLMDGNRREIYEHAVAEAVSPRTAASKRFTALAAEYGYQTIEMHSVFADHWRRYRERLDFLPMDGHWNRVAHKLAAQEVAKRLNRHQVAMNAP